MKRENKNKKDMSKFIKILVWSSVFISCVNQQNKDEEQIRKTVNKFWDTIKRDDIEGYKELFYDNEIFLGSISADFYFLHNNYDEISKSIQGKKLKIKDTIVFLPENRKKYVQYIIKKDNDSNNLYKPLIITLMFYKPVGYDKIYNSSPLDNHIGWGKKKIYE